MKRAITCTLMLSLLGCSSSSDNDGIEEFEGFSGSWQSGCVSLAGGARSSSFEKTYSGNTLTFHGLEYLGSGCDTVNLVFETDFVATLTVGGGIILASGETVYPIDRVATFYEVAIHDPDYIISNNDNDEDGPSCGYTDWTLGEAKDVLDCSNDGFNFDYYFDKDVVKVEDGELTFGVKVYQDYPTELESYSFTPLVE